MTNDKTMPDETLQPDVDGGPGDIHLHNIEEETATAEEVSQEAEPVVPEADFQALNTRYMRLLADFDNYKRRVNQEKKDLVQYSNMELIKEMLPVLDAFELGLQAVPEEKDENLAAFVEGTEKIRKQLIDVLGKAGLTEIEADCTPFDPNYHEAIMLVEDDSVPPQTITDVLRTGYMFKEKVIRPTVCRVSQG